MLTDIVKKTSDNVDISINYYNNNFENVIIIAPGWCMTKDSKAFKKISDNFSKFFDVLCFDFRGHGKSRGFYTFTAKELNDLQVVVNFAKMKEYKKIFLIGFSLGASLVINFSAKNSDITKVIAVSPASDFSKIENQMWKKEAWAETFKKFELSRFLSVRPYPFPLKKEKTIDLIKEVKCPTLFIAGGKDPTVYAWHTEILYKEAICNKEYKLYPNGYHAEDLFLYYEDDFMNNCLNWLNKQDIILKR